MSTINHREIIDKSWRLRREKRFAEAEMLLHDALTEVPENSYSYRLLKANLADILFHSGNHSEARKAALEVLASDPDNASALTVVGMVALDMKEPAEAIENLQKAYGIMPSSFRAGRLARAYELDNDFSRAIDLLAEVLRKNPRDNYLLNQYRALEKKAADKQNRSDSGSTNPALEAEIEEEDFLPYAEKIRARLQKLEPTDGIEQLQKLIRIGRRKTNPYLYILLGDLLRQASDEEAAFNAYKQAHELDSQNLLALSQLIYSYRRLGNKEEAWPLLKLLLYKRPGDVTAKSSLLKDADEMGKEEEARIFFEELLQKYPQHKELYGAIRKLKKAVKPDRKDEQK